MRLTREGKVFYPAEPCEGLDEKILLMQAGGLSEADEKQLMAHIETCVACNTLYRHYELIDENIRDHLAAQQNKPPKAMPKKLRLMLSEANKQHFVSRLHELGHSILFQQPLACDQIRPWSEPLPIDQSMSMLNNSCRSVMRDPLIQEVGLAPNFVEDCRKFLHNLVANPISFLNLENAKEALDRALSIEPKDIFSSKTLFEYYYLNDDYTSSINIVEDLLNNELTSSQRWSMYMKSCSVKYMKHDYQDALQDLVEAEKINNNSSVSFIKFLCAFYMNDFHEAEVNIVKMDQKLKSDTEDPNATSLIYKCFYRNFDYFRNTTFFNKRSTSDLIIKYRGCINDYLL